MKLSLLSLIACTLPALAHPVGEDLEDPDVEVTTVVVGVTTTICPTPTPPPPPCGSGGGHGGSSSTSSALSSTTSTIPPTGTPKSQDLALNRDWELDESDFSQLEMKKSCRMMYAKQEVPLGTKPPSTDPLAWVIMNETAYPNIQTVNSKYFEKVWCDLSEGWIKMKFSSWDAYDYAWDNWHDVARPQWGDYVIITPELSCKNYDATQERYFIKATSEERDDGEMVITCKVEDISFGDTAGPENPVEIQFENFSQGNKEDGRYSAQANEAGENGQFTDLGGEDLRDPSGDSDFDQYRDSQIGRMDLATLNQGLLDEFNVTLEDFYGGSDLPDLVQERLNKRGLLSKIKKAVKKVVQKVKTAVATVVETVKKVAETVVEVAKQVADAIAEFTTIDKSISKSLDFDTSKLGRIVETPFGGKDGYLLFEADFKNTTEGGVDIDGSLDIFCVECGIEGDFQIRGQVVFVVSRLKFETGFVEITGSMGAGLGVGIVAQLSVTKTFEKQITSLPLTPFSIPNIFVLGPKLDLGAGVDFNLEANGQLLAGAKANWPSIKATLDIVESSRSGVSGFTPIITPVFEVEGEIALTTTFFLKFSLGVGLDVLNGLFDKSVELIDKPGMFISAGVGASFDLENGVGGVGDDDCAGLNLAVGFNNEVSVNVFDIFEKVIDSREIEAFQRCIPFFAKRGISPWPLLEGRQDAGTSGAIGETTFDGGALGRMFLHDEDEAGALRLRFSPNGNTYAVPDSKVPEAEKEWSSWFATDASGAIVVGDSHGRFYHGYRDTLIETGVSRLRLHKTDDMPKTAQPMVIAAIGVEADDTTALARRDELPYMIATDLGGNVYFPIMCVYANEQVYPKMFLANDTEIGTETLMSNTPEIIQLVTGGRVKTCEYVPLTNGVPGQDIGVLEGLPDEE